MYYPYFRGKQNELLLLKEQAKLILNSKITPIIEPVNKNISALDRAIKELDSVNAKYIILINPICGDFKQNNSSLLKSIAEYENKIIGINITEKSDMNVIVRLLDEYNGEEIALIHQGFTKGKELAEAIKEYNISKHIFVESKENSLYQRHFKNQGQNILIKDAFQKRDRNSDYPPHEHFSELHITYRDYGMDGFGDFLIAGSSYSKSGGPAKAVAIHSTYLEKNEEDNMYIKHYVSDDIETTSNTAGKFHEALKKFVSDINRYPEIFDTKACKEYCKHHKNEHFPGLGVVKKLSMQHHVETIAKYLKENL